MNGNKTWGLRFSLLTLAGLMSLFYLYLDNKLSIKPNVITGADASIRIELSPDKHFYAQGKINGYPLVFLIDTGASGIAINEALANKIGLTKGSKGLSQTANGTTPYWHTQIDTLSIGEHTLTRLPASILPNLEAQALLGMSYLRHFEWTQRDGVLILKPLKP